MITWKIARAELQTLFYSPLAWLTLVLLGVVVFGKFFDLFDLAVRGQQIGQNVGRATAHLLTVRQPGHVGLLPAVIDQLYYFFPLLTMGLISRETSTGSIKLFDSSPVTTAQLVGGKFASMCLFSLLLIGVIVVAVAAVALTVPHFEWGLVLAALAGMWLLMCTYSAIGLFISSLTAYPIAAAALTFGALAGLSWIGGVWQQIDFVRELTWWLAINNRIGGFMAGIISSADVAYYLVVVAMCLTLTWLRLFFRKNTFSWTVRLAACFGVFAAALALGWASSLPALRLYADLTHDGRNTIAPASRQIMREQQGQLRVTTFVNVLHADADLMKPEARNRDLSRYEPWQRFHPDMHFDYVYYWGETSRLSHFAASMVSLGATADSTARRFCQINGINPRKLLTAEQAARRAPIDLAAEDFSVVVALEAASGRAQALRLFDDNEKYPSENETALAFRALTQPETRVKIDGLSLDGSPEGYFEFFGNRTRRGALINQGFRIADNAEIPDSAPDIWVSDHASPLLNDYLHSGGNAMLLHDVDSPDNPAAQMGVTFAPGYLVQPHPSSEELYPHIILAEAVSELVPRRATLPLRMSGAIATMPPDAQTIYISPPEGWLKLQKADLLAEGLKPEPGETPGSHPVMVAIERGRQRVVAAADAGWLTNAGLASNFVGVRTATPAVALSLMHWLSEGHLPLPGRSYAPRDVRIDFSDTHIDWIYYLYIWVLPCAMAFTGAFLYRKRNRR